MNLHVSSFGELSPEQKAMVQRAIKIREEEQQLHIEIQTISRELGYQGINLWDEMRSLKNNGQI